MRSSFLALLVVGFIPLQRVCGAEAPMPAFPRWSVTAIKLRGIALIYNNKPNNWDRLH